MPSSYAICLVHSCSLATGNGAEVLDSWGSCDAWWLKANHGRGCPAAVKAGGEAGGEADG